MPDRQKYNFRHVWQYHSDVEKRKQQQEYTGKKKQAVSEKYSIVFKQPLR